MPSSLSLVTLTNALLLILLWHLPNAFVHQIINYGLLMLTISFGLSHGALDWYQAKRLQLIQSKPRTLIFLSTYIATASAFVYFLYLTPMVAWSGFLIISIWHFSNDWIEQSNLWFRLAFAAMIVCMPTLTHPIDTSILFELVIPKDYIHFLMASMAYVAKISLCLTLLGIIKYKNWDLGLEWLVLLSICFSLPPFSYFCFYFCQLHAYKHWQRNFNLNENALKKLVIPIVLTSFCILAGLMFFLSYPLSYQNALKIIIIELAALTIPHWILIHILTPMTNKHLQ
jgi:Brp/Blh family beta-carotene 15,15'-monooxygenase